MNQELLNQVIEALLTLALLIITGVLIPEVKKWIKSKTDNEVINTVTNELFREVDIAVNYVEQTMVKQLKKDKKWDTKSQKKALETAVNVVLSNISQKTSAYLQENSSNIVETVKQYIEANILYKKQS